MIRPWKPSYKLWFHNSNYKLIGYIDHDDDWFTVKHYEQLLAYLNNLLIPQI